MKTQSPLAWIVLLASVATVTSCDVRVGVGNNYGVEAKAGAASGPSPASGQAAGGAAGGSDGSNTSGDGSIGAVANIAGRASTGGGGPSSGNSGGKDAGYGGGGGGSGSSGGGDAGAENGSNDETPLSFAAPVRYPGGSWAFDIAVADLNGDGALDVASADFGSVRGGAFVWLNHGDGTFGEAAPYLPERQATSIAIGDFDGDAKPELILANNDDTSLLSNEGDGTFSAPSALAAPTSVVRALDANGDTKLDFVADSSLYINQGGGIFGASASVAFSTARVAADLNADGQIDLVGGGGKVLVSLNAGGGAFAPRGAYTTGTSVEGSMVRGPAVGDVNGDGWPDIAAANDRQATASVLLNQGDGTFSLAHTYPAGSWPTAVAIGDLNGDGWPELVVANSDIAYSITNGPRYLGVHRNRGDGTFETPAELVPVEYGYALALADVDGDQRLDIVVGDSGGGLNVVLNTAH